jgi:ferrochelatase
MKRAVILFNLGGPDSLDAVQPFLFNLFNDPAIMTLPGPLRWVLAKLISRRRAPVAREIYGKIGGSSPLLVNTEAQARALEAALGEGHRCFVAMRYWRPFSAAVAAAVKTWAPDNIVLLPLYPQFSTTTTASSLRDWQASAARAGLSAPTHALCSYPREEGFVAAVAELTRRAIGELGDRPLRVLFSAHGLPQKIVEAGDPYQWQVEATVARVVEALAMPELDWTICYQSRVGPLAWIGPSTDAEVARAGRDAVAAVVVPISFVSEHSETLVELDIEYRHLAEKAGVPAYIRVSTVGTHPAFIGSLARLVRAAAGSAGIVSGEGGRICPASFTRCPLAAPA